MKREDMLVEFDELCGVVRNMIEDSRLPVRLQATQVEGEFKFQLAFDVRSQFQELTSEQD